MDDELFGDLGILDSNEEEHLSKGPLPGGLTALCILTFVGSGLILIKDLFTYYIYAVAFSVKNSIDKNSGIDGADGVFGSLTLVYFLEALTCVGAIVAAILILRRKKVGLHIYLISTILYCVAIVWFWFLSLRIELNEGLIFLLFLYLAVPIGFVIMYNSYRKYLR